jgi:hypothetical protein
MIAGIITVDQPAQVQVSPWRVVGAAVRGTSHVRHGLPCQDAQGYRSLPGGGLLIAVADGAGSARLSEFGARSAVSAGLDALEAALGLYAPNDEAAWQEAMWGAFASARVAVNHLAKAEGHRLRDYATTLTMAAVSGGWLATGQVGDGSVVAQEAGGRLFAATRAQKGEYANETHFLTQRDAHKHLKVHTCFCPIVALAVMSDGLLRLALKLPSGDPHQPFFQPLFRFAAAAGDSADGQLADFLTSERVCARSDDDKSLVLAAYTASRALTVRAVESEAA